MIKINSYVELIKYLENNLNTKINVLIEENIDNKEIGYVIEKEEFNELYINYNNFFKCSKKIEDFFIKLIKKDLNDYKIPDILLTKKLINFILKNDGLCKKLKKLNNCIILNRELISLVFEHNNITNEFISGQYILDILNLTEDELEDELDYFRINGYSKIFFVPRSELDKQDLINFLNNESSSVNQYDERKYIEKVKETLNKLQSDERNYDVIIMVSNRELLKQSGILEMKGFNFFLMDYCIKYTKEEYEREEEYLNELVRPIKEANLSSFERYIAVYNIVKKFKLYKENYQNPDESRYLKYILHNKYMVCLGFSNLLKVLLDKVGISSFITICDIDKSYNNGFSLEDKPTDFQRNHHARNIVKIDDDKYGIHGIYLADSTWDNNLENDMYFNAALTFDKKKEAKNLEGLKVIDLLMDFHNMEEFTEKFKYLVKQMEKPDKDGLTLKDGYIRYLICLKIIDLLKKIDYDQYEKKLKKYEDKLELLKDGLTEESKNIFVDFLDDYLEYIIPLMNNQIDNKKMMVAALHVKKFLDKYDDEALIKWYMLTCNLCIEGDKIAFPYLYNPVDWKNNKLEVKDKNKR